MEPFKNSFNKTTVIDLSQRLHKIEPNFDRKSFERFIMEELESLELKDRVKRISNGFKREFDNLKFSYHKSLTLLLKLLKGKEGLTGFQVWPISQFVEDFGQENLKSSLKTFSPITKAFTSEFCIRPFIDKYPEEIYEYLENLTRSSCEHERRFVSEGIRPNLPWGLKSRYVISNLQRNLSLLEKLKHDKSPYVIQSIANHLNDISRLDEKLYFKTVKKWSKDPSVHSKVIRHSSRTLLKKGHPEALKLHGYNPKLKLGLSRLKLAPKKIREGEKFNLSFNLFIDSKNDLEKVLVDYLIHFPKKDGSYSIKAFRMKDFKANTQRNIQFDKLIHFKKVTTRKHYLGKYFVEIQVNGQVLDKTYFTLY